MQPKTKKIIAGIATAFVVATAGVGTMLPDDDKLPTDIMQKPIVSQQEATYELEPINDYQEALVIDLPENLDDKLDIMQLYLGRDLITEGAYPNQKLTSHPVVFKPMTNLRVVFYRKGEAAAYAEFDNDGKVKLNLFKEAEQE